MTNSEVISALLAASKSALEFIFSEYSCATSSALDGDPLSKDARGVRDVLCDAISKAEEHAK